MSRSQTDPENFFPTCRLIQQTNRTNLEADYKISIDVKLGEYPKESNQLILEYSNKAHQIMIHNSRTHHILVSIRYDNTFKKWLEINQNNWSGKYRKLSIGNGTTNIGNGVWHSEDACEVNVQRASYSVLFQIKVLKIPCKVKRLNRN